MEFEIVSIRFNSCGVELEVDTDYNGYYSIEGRMSLSYHEWDEGKEWSIKVDSLAENNEYVSVRMLEQLDELVTHFNENICVNLQNETLVVNNPTVLQVGSNFKL